MAGSVVASGRMAAGAVTRAYLVALDPTAAQAQMLQSHCGAQRFAYNFGLALVRANLDQRADERSYGIAEHDPHPAGVVVGVWPAPGVERRER